MAESRTDVHAALFEHSGFLQALARGLLGDDAAAEDAVQSTWVAALERPPRDLRTPRAWLARVTANAARDRRRSRTRRRQREREGARPETQPAADAGLLREETLRAVSDAVLALDEPYRSTVLLRFYEGLDARAIAARENVPLPTVRSRLTRALERLRERLDRTHGGDREAWSAGLVALVGAERAGAPTAASATASGTGGSAASAGGLFASAQVKLLAAALALCTLALGVPRLRDLLEARQPTDERVSAAAAVTPTVRAEPRDLTVTADPARAGAAGSSGRVALAATGSVHARVTWSDGSPADGIHLKVHGYDPPMLAVLFRYVRTDERGEVQIDGVPAGRIGLFSDRGHPVFVDVAAGRTSAATIVLPEEILVHGRVLDLAGRPVADAEIWLSDYGDVGSGTVVARSAGDGGFAIRDVSPTHEVCAKKEGHAASPCPRFSGRPGHARELELVLQGPAARLELAVVGPDGEPVAGARVRIRPLDYPQEGYPRDVHLEHPIAWNGTTDADGLCTATSLVPGENELVVGTLDLAGARRSLELTPGTEALTVRLGRGVTVEGVVRDPGGAPIGGVAVGSGRPGALDARATRSAADGSFRLGPLPAGDLEVVASLRGTGRAVWRTAAGDGDRVAWDPVMDSGRVLSGRLTDEAGLPLSGWSVYARDVRDPAPSTFSGKAVTEADGSFQVVSCPEGPLRAVAFAPRETPAFPEAEFQGLRADAEPCELRVLDAQRASAWIVGRVVDAAGRPRTATLILRHPLYAPGASPRFGDHWARNDEATGEFRIGPLAPGSYGLTAVEEEGGRRTFVSDVALGADETRDLGDLVPGGPGRLAVSVTVPGGIEPETVQVLVQGLGPSDRRPRHFGLGRLPEEIELPAGRYEVRVGGAVLSETRAVDVRPGELTELEVAPAPGVRVALRFDLPEGCELPLELDLAFRPASGEVWRTTAWLVHEPGVPQAFQNLAVVIVPPAAGYSLEVAGPNGLAGRAVLEPAVLGAADGRIETPTIVVVR